MSSIRDLQDRIRTLVGSTVEGLGYDLVAVEWLSDTRGPILRLSVEKPGGIDANDCGRVSRHVSQIMDEADPIEQSYRLEVSSPGIERPVQRASDFARLAGYRIRVRLIEGQPRRKFSGTLAGADGDEGRVAVDGQEIRFPIGAVERANLILDLDEYQRLGAALGVVPEEEPAEDADAQE